MAPQTSILSAPPIGFEGQLGTGGPFEAVALQNQTGSPIPFGRFVIRDAAKPDLGCKLPSALSDVCVGIALYEPAIEADANGLRQYADGSNVTVLRKGYAIMIPEQAMTPADPCYMRVTVDGGDATKTPGRLRKDNDGGTSGTKQRSKLTLNGALDGGRRRIQKLVLSADLVAADQVDGKIGGTAIAATTFAVDHASTMAAIVAAIRAAAVTAGVQLLDILIAGATLREIHIYSADVGAATAPLLDWAVTHGGAGTAVFAAAVGADVTAGKDAHELQARIGGTLLYKAGWAGTHDDTVALFADQLRGDARIGSVEVTKVPGTEDLVLYIEALTAAVNPIAIDQNQVNGGVNARTLTADETIAVGAAAVAAKAVLLQRVTIEGSALAGKPCLVRVDL